MIRRLLARIFGVESVYPDAAAQAVNESLSLDEDMTYWCFRS